MKWGKTAGFGQNSSGLHLIALMSGIAWREAMEGTGRTVCEAAAPCSQSLGIAWGHAACSWQSPQGRPLSQSERVNAASDAKHLTVPGGSSLERQPQGCFSSALSISPAGFIATNPASLGLQALVAMDSGGGVELSTKTNKTCDNENTSGLYDSAKQLQLR